MMMEPVVAEAVMACGDAALRMTLTWVLPTDVLESTSSGRSRPAGIRPPDIQRRAAGLGCGFRRTPGQPGLGS